MTTAQLDTIYLDVAAGVNAARQTCECDDASLSDLLKVQYALDGIAAMLSKVRSGAPDDGDVQRMLDELAEEVTLLRLLTLQRLSAYQRAA